MILSWCHFSIFKAHILESETFYIVDIYCNLSQMTKEKYQAPLPYCTDSVFSHFVHRQVHFPLGETATLEDSESKPWLYSACHYKITRCIYL